MDIPFILLCLFAFLAGFIDSIVGGGGLVQIPAFFILYPQLSVQNIISTNRLASAAGTSVAAYNYLRSVKVPWPALIAAGIAAAVCSYLGALLQSYVPPSVLKPVIFGLIVLIALHTYRHKAFGQQEAIKIPSGDIPLYGALIGGALGAYNGLIGPGTGSLLVFGFVSVIGYSFLTASAISKVVNVIADVFSLVYFLINGHVLFHLALPMLVCNVSGAYIGSRMAVLRGNQFIRKVFMVVLIGLLLRFAWDIFKL